VFPQGSEGSIPSLGTIHLSCTSNQIIASIPSLNEYIIENIKPATIRKRRMELIHTPILASLSCLFLNTPTMPTIRPAEIKIGIDRINRKFTIINNLSWSAGDIKRSEIYDRGNVSHAAAVQSSEYFPK
jgi:hypothetical protein